MNWAFPLILGVLGMAWHLGIVGRPSYFYSEDLLCVEMHGDFWPNLAFSAVALFLCGGAAWWCVRDWVGRALLSLFLDAARREEIGLDAPEAVASEGI